MTTFKEVFPKFEVRDDTLFIGMDEDVVEKLSTKDAIKFSRMKFEKAWQLIRKMNPKEFIFPQFGTGTCPLCVKFLDNRGVEYCHGCPIFDKTGIQYCEASPYEKIVEAHYVSEYVPALLEEIKFLKELEDEFSEI